ncbi:MAG: cation:proton antiporter [Ahniella sp.]|nr:cation:proton antiporter [Ahniella sp.]
MPHDIGLITTLAAGFGLALVFGLAASWARLPPIIGYLLAGVMIGPATPGYVGDLGLAAQLAEIGVMLLMFGVGLHFSLDDLMSVRRIAVPGALLQIGLATLAGYLAARYWGWTDLGALVFGLCLSVASTVVLLRALEAREMVKTVDGQIAVGWLVVEDLVMVLVLVLLPALVEASQAAEGNGGWQLMAKAMLFTLLKVSAFIALMLVIGRRVFPRLLWWVARTGSRELFTLCVVAVAIGVAFGASMLFDVSFALGAFFAGMMMRESEYSHRAAADSLPLREAFSVLFFVSVGMLFDPRVVVDEPIRLAITVGIIVIGKTLAAIVLVLAMRYPLRSALVIGASLAQIGEFSFILAGLGLSLGVMPAEGQSLVLAAAVVAIAANGLLFRAIEPTHRWVQQNGILSRRLALRDDPLAQLPMSVDQAKLTGQVVLVGYGRIGRAIARRLQEQDIPYVVAEQNRDIVESGDASTPEVLIQAHIARASMLVIAIPDTLNVRQMAEIARALNPEISILVRAHHEDEAELLRSDGIGEVLVGEHELARGMSERITAKLKPASAAGKP